MFGLKSGLKSGLKDRTTSHTHPADEQGTALNQHFWMPFSANRDFRANPRMIAGAEGRYYIDDQGRKLFDSLSGLWTCGAGHNREEIQKAVAAQLGTLDFAPGFQIA
ncbi:MAG TPA: aspartate aminotransferase family protein, partial [Halomonas sp.]|nr:aspartate aminotransferase family protein [Halomonas sp.]